MLAVIVLFAALVSLGQDPEGQSSRQQSPAPQATPTPSATASPSASAVASPSPLLRRPQEQPAPTPEEPPVVTHHEIKVAGKTLRYTATVGMMPIKNRDG